MKEEEELREEVWFGFRETVSEMMGAARGIAT